MLFYTLIFIISCLLLIVSGNWLVNSLSKISEFLGLKEFTVAFLLMSLATAMPEMFIGLSSAVRGVPELSLGNILGQNIIHFTIAVFICVLIRGSFSVQSKTTRITAYFAGFMAVFPLILMLDTSISRIDGFILILLFFAYVLWMLKKGKRFEEKFDALETQNSISLWNKVKIFFNSTGKFALGILVLIIASQGIVKSSIFFAESLNMPLVVIGVLIVGLGTALPEVYFSAYSSFRKDGAELMAGNLLGSTVVSTSLVIGIISMISPITDIHIFSYFSSRFTLFISVLLFIYFMSTERSISKKEGIILVSIYLIFVFLQITY